MMRHKCPLIASVCFALVSAVAAAGQVDLTAVYYLPKQQLPLARRLDFAISILNTSADRSLSEAAITDVVSLSKDRETLQKAIRTLDAVLARVPKGSETYQQAYLAQARLLFRLGQKDAASSMFRIAVQNRWIAPKNEPAFRYYARALAEAEGPRSAALLEYKFLTGNQEVLDETEFNFLSYFFNWVWAMKRNDPSSSALEDIYPLLPESDRGTVYKAIARALCLTADGRHDEAVSLLQEIEEDLPVTASDYTEYRNIPLYIAAALYLKGDSAQAQLYLQRFWSRNTNRPEYVLRKALVITYRLQSLHDEGGHQRMADVTSFLAGTPLLRNDSIRRQISDNSLSHFLDMHQMALMFQGRWHEAKAVCERIVEDYSPENTGYANALYTLGTIALSKEKDLDKAERIFLQILSDRIPNEELERFSLEWIVRIRTKRGDPLQSIEPLIERLYERAPTEGERSRFAAMLARLEAKREAAQ